MCFEPIQTTMRMTTIRILTTNYGIHVKDCLHWDGQSGTDATETVFVVMSINIEIGMIVLGWAICPADPLYWKLPSSVLHVSIVFLLVLRFFALTSTKFIEKYNAVFIINVQLLATNQLLLSRMWRVGKLPPVVKSFIPLMKKTTTVIFSY